MFSFVQTHENVKMQIILWEERNEMKEEFVPYCEKFTYPSVIFSKDQSVTPNAMLSKHSQG